MILFTEFLGHTGQNDVVVVVVVIYTHYPFHLDCNNERCSITVLLSIIVVSVRTTRGSFCSDSYAFLYTQIRSISEFNAANPNAVTAESSAAKTVVCMHFLCGNDFHCCCEKPSSFYVFLSWLLSSAQGVMMAQPHA